MPALGANASAGPGWTGRTSLRIRRSKPRDERATSPGDPDVHLWHDGATGELAYSPKVVEMMGRLLREEEEGL